MKPLKFVLTSDVTVLMETWRGRALFWSNLTFQEINRNFRIPIKHVSHQIKEKALVFQIHNEYFQVVGLLEYLDRMHCSFARKRVLSQIFLNIYLHIS